MNPDSVNVRIEKNVKLIKELLSKVEAVVDMIDNDPHPDYGDLGDLAHIRENLFNIMGKEDQAPPQG